MLGSAEAVNEYRGGSEATARKYWLVCALLGEQHLLLPAGLLGCLLGAPTLALDGGEGEGMEPGVMEGELKCPFGALMLGEK